MDYNLHRQTATRAEIPVTGLLRALLLGRSLRRVQGWSPSTLLLEKVFVCLCFAARNYDGQQGSRPDVFQADNPRVAVTLMSKLPG